MNVGGALLLTTVGGLGFPRHAPEAADVGETLLLSIAFFHGSMNNQVCLKAYRLTLFFFFTALNILRRMSFYLNCCVLHMHGLLCAMCPETWV